MQGDSTMNDLIVKLYEQATVLEGNGDYVAGELDPVNFAKLIVKECASIDFRRELGLSSDQDYEVSQLIKKHFGVE